MPDWLSEIRRKVPLHQPEPEVLEDCEAAVLMAVTDDPQDPHLILTQRAHHLSSHAGEVAFPGGKRDPEDETLEQTALRESFEEILLPPEQVEVIGPMPFSVSKAGLKVVPYIGIIPSQQRLVPSEHEIDSLFSVPLRYFLDTEPPDYTIREFQGVRYRVPCYHFEDYIIWGLTAYFITDSFNRIFNTGFQLAIPKPLPNK